MSIQAYIVLAAIWVSVPLWLLVLIGITKGRPE